MGEFLVRFLQKFQHLRTSVRSFEFKSWSCSVERQPSHKPLPLMGTFSHKFSIAHSNKTTDRKRKS